MLSFIRSTTATGAAREIQKAIKEDRGTKLDLTGRKLKELPEELYTTEVFQQGLQWLNLSDNELETLPDELVHLEKLVWLNVSQNFLSALPTGLLHIQSLSELILQGNRLPSIPSDICKLTQLAKLNLKCNKLKELPGELGGLTNLTDLDVSQNELVTLPPALFGAAKLTMLNISENRIQVLPIELCSLHRLRILDARGNPLQSPPSAIATQGVQAVFSFLRDVTSRSRSSSMTGSAHVRGGNGDSGAAICNLSKTTISGPALSDVSVGKHTSFVINAIDSSGHHLKAGGLSFVVTISDVVGNKSFDVPVADKGNGLYSVNFVLSKVGDYLIKVELDGSHVAGSPFVCSAKEDRLVPSAATCYADGDGLKTGFVDVMNTFYVYSVGASGSPAPLSEFPFKLNVVHIASQKRVPTFFGHLNLQKASWTVTYEPKLAGEHSIIVTIGDQHLKGSPYTVNVRTATTDPASVVAEPRRTLTVLDATFGNSKQTSAPPPVSPRAASTGKTESDRRPSNVSILSLPSTPRDHSDSFGEGDNASIEETSWTRLGDAGQKGVPANSIIDEFFADLNSVPESLKFEDQTSALMHSWKVDSVGSVGEKPLRHVNNSMSSLATTSLHLFGADPHRSAIVHINDLSESRRPFHRAGSLAVKLQSQLQDIRSFDQETNVLRGAVNLAEYHSALQALQESSKRVHNAVSDKAKAQVDELARERNLARIKYAKVLMSTLHSAEALYKIEQQKRQIVADGAELLTDLQKDMEITTVSNDTVEDATKAFNGWQAEILNAFGAQIERTNTLMQQLIESINSEKLLLEQHNELVGKGPSLVARLVLARQKDLSNQSAVPASFTAPAIYDSTMEASWKSVYYYFFDAASALAQLPNPEQVDQLVRQVKTLRSGQRDLQKELLSLHNQLAQLQTVPARDASKILTLTSQISTNQRSQQAVVEKEQALLTQLRHYAHTEYPELRLQLASLLMPSPPPAIQTTPVIPAANIPVLLQDHGYSGAMAINSEQSVFLATNSLGEKCVIKKFPINPQAFSQQAQTVNAFVEFFRRPPHQSLCAASGYFIQGTTVFIERPFYGGVSLSEWIGEGINSVPVNDVRNVFYQILAGLAALHAKGMVHGYLSSDDIIIVSSKSGTIGTGHSATSTNSSSRTRASIVNTGPEGLRAIICGLRPFPPTADTQLTSEDFQAPEVESGANATAASDLWSFGSIMCEACSEEHKLPAIASKTVVVIPPMQSRLNAGNHLRALLHNVLQVAPHNRLSASAAIVSTYFTQTAIAPAIEDVRTSFPFEKRLLDISLAIHAGSTGAFKPGLVVIEVDCSEDDPAFGLNLLDCISAVHPDDMHKRWLITLKKVKNKALPSWVLLQKAVTSLMGSYSGVTLLEASKHTLPELTTYLPNAIVSDTRHYRSLGRLLAICLWMAFPVSFGFPSCLYRMLIARSGAGNPAALKLHDLDQFDPMTALQLRLKLADVVYSPAKLEPLHQAVHNAIRASLVTGRQPQFSAMSAGFAEMFGKQPELLDGLGELSTFELMLLFEAPFVSDGLSMERLAGALVFQDFVDNVSTKEHVLRYLSSLSDVGRRLFVFVATSRVRLIPGEQITIHCQSAHLSPDADGSSSSEQQQQPLVLQRIFLNQLELAPHLSYAAVGDAIRSTMLLALSA